MSDEEVPDLSETPDPDEDHYATLAHGHLSPRHRRLALLFAQGRSNKEVAEELGYVGSRVSILKKNPFIAEEIRRITERIYEDTIGNRLKSFAEPALQNIQMILTDRLGKVKTSEKAEMSKWVIEKLDGKASQKVDIGENMLGVFFDRLDSLEASGKSLSPRPVNQTDESNQPLALTAGEPPPPREKTKDELLAEWCDDFMAQGEIITL